MSIYLKLVKALIASVEPTAEEKGRKKIFYGIMAFIAVFFIMINSIILSLMRAAVNFEAIIFDGLSGRGRRLSISPEK